MITKVAEAGTSRKAMRPMELALAEAEQARDLGEVPLGAVIVSAGGKVLGGAVEHGPRFFQQPTCHHAPEVIGGLGETRAAALLKDFFAARR